MIVADRTVGEAAAGLSRPTLLLLAPPLAIALAGGARQVTSPCRASDNPQRFVAILPLQLLAAVYTRTHA